MAISTWYLIGGFIALAFIAIRHSIKLRESHCESHSSANQELASMDMMIRSEKTAELARKRNASAYR